MALISAVAYFYWPRFSKSERHAVTVARIVVVAVAIVVDVIEVAGVTRVRRPPKTTRGLCGISP